MSQNSGYVTFLGAPNYADAKYGTTLISGSAVGLLPVTNLQNPKLYKVWRTATVSASQTWVQANFTAKRTIGGVSLVRHNFSQNAKWRVRLGDDATFLTFDYDSGWMDVWPMRLEFGSLDWGSFDWGDILPQESLEEIVLNAYHLPEVSYSVFFLRIDIEDPDNEEGFLESGRLVAGPRYQPSINMQYGWSIGFEDDSTATKSRGGVLWGDEEERYRVARFQLVDLTEAELFNNIFDHIDRRKGILGDMVLIPQPSHLDQLHNQAFYGRLRKLDPNVNANYQGWDRTFEFEELL